jgi:hypothetical protein
MTISPGIPSEAFCIAQTAAIPNSLFWPEAQDDFMARVRDGLARHLEQAHRAMAMLETVVHLRFGRMQDDRTSRQIIQLWVAAPEKDAFFLLTQIQSLHGVTQISNSLRYMWVVSKETRKLQSPVFDKGLMTSPPLRSLPSFDVLSNFWMRLDRTTERMTLGQFLAKVKAFYVGHDRPAPAIIDAYLLQSSAMAAEPSFMLCLVSAIDLAQLAADLQPLGLLRASLGTDFFIRLGHHPTEEEREGVHRSPPRASGVDDRRRSFGEAAKRASSPKRPRPEPLPEGEVGDQALLSPPPLGRQSGSIVPLGAPSSETALETMGYDASSRRGSGSIVPLEAPSSETATDNMEIDASDDAGRADLVPVEEAQEATEPGSSAPSSEFATETMDIDATDEAGRAGLVPVEKAQETPEPGFSDLSDPGRLASRYPPEQHGCALTAIAASVLETSVPFLMTEERLTNLMRDLTTRDLVSHFLTETIRANRADCPRHLGEQAMTAWRHALDAGAGPFPPEAMLPLHVVIQFLPPGAILLFPQEGERGFWLEWVAKDGPLRQDDLVTAVQTSPILIVVTVTSQEGVLHLDTISRTDWEVRTWLADQATSHPGAFEQSSLSGISPGKMHSMCGSRDQNHICQGMAELMRGGEVSTVLGADANPRSGGGADVLTHRDQLVSIFSYPQYTCGLVAITAGFLVRYEFPRERTRDCLTDPISRGVVNDWLEYISQEGTCEFPGHLVHAARQHAAALQSREYMMSPPTPAAMVPFHNVVALAPKGSLNVRIMETGVLGAEVSKAAAYHVE